MYYKINKYPDGSSYISILDSLLYKVKEGSWECDFRINSYEDLWHLNQLVDTLNHNGMKPTITIPCLFDAQADRRFKSNESSGLKLLCEFLDNMHANFIIFHPHNPEVVEALIDDVVILDNSNFVAHCLEDIVFGRDEYKNDLEFEENTILMSADAGGFKPLMKVADAICWRGETYSASKARKYVDGKSRLTQIVDREDFGGKDIVIIDDLCVYGGTFKGLSKLLKERNCGKLYLAVSHITMQDLGEDPVTNYFDFVFTTNSKYREYYSNGVIPNNLIVNPMFHCL